MLFTESVVFLATLWAAFSLGTIYLFTQSVEQIYGQLYGWNSLQAGYVQVAIGIGEVFECGLCMYTNRWYYDSAVRNTEVPGTTIPEARLYPSVIGGFLGVTGGKFFKYAASALIENAALAFIPLASASMYTDLRFQWASSLLALLSLALVATPFAVFKWGKQIRSRSPFMKEAIIERHHAVLQQPLRV
ncbi:uncharacterized protein EAE98_003257 [Botrytis deweyae]|uniref:Uncharacterized protein n=1 Tax=Botrytis deweyae TaxID=2478750 RepID=A0ABQ7ITV2_9HELO|nr:uncharacterized protein EAE98_003257 [Botrytis deweyae]KAF7933548.1 hypothetical protein EAE98_003257 [Botrytis deweyae]